MLSEHIPIASRKDTRVKDTVQAASIVKVLSGVFFLSKGLDKRIIVWYTDSVMRKIIGNIIGFGIVLYLLVYISIPILTILFT